jgi:FdhE protein
MTDPGIGRLEALAESDPTVAPMARLLALAFRAAEEAGWAASLPRLDGAGLADGLPVLQGAELPVDGARLQRHFEAVEAAAGVTSARRLDAFAPVAASIRQDADALAGLAAAAGLEPDLLGTIAHAAGLPILLAAGRAAGPILSADRGWEAGYCPVCAAWPTLAELRGLARERWLRCGRCGSGWRDRPGHCPFCVGGDHRQLAYLAPAADRDSRRASTCDACRGYLKTVSVLGPASAAELAGLDLSTLELDVAALERGYARPERPGFPLAVTLAPARRPGRGLLRRLAGRP